MVCPYCNIEYKSVFDTRKTADGYVIRRRRKCDGCDQRFTTYEKSEIDLLVVKRSGVIEKFEYKKLLSGIESAFSGTEVKEKDILKLVDKIYLLLKKKGSKLKSDEIGEIVLNSLKEFNDVAYLRFASVYKEFNEVSDFEREAAELS